MSYINIEKGAQGLYHLPHKVQKQLPHLFFKVFTLGSGGRHFLPLAVPPPPKILLALYERELSWVEWRPLLQIHMLKS